ncbi:MAG: preprotein translocase subunit YajC [Verrucomicrobiia bacterium Tous-C5FEB]|nr:MAG: preprotein translocase subunit YajC [Verrucomicrobiae bacterium Tous-C5FEB]
MTTNTLLTTLLAQAAPAPQGGNLVNTLIMMGLMVVMFYFLLIRPQQRQRKEQAARIAALQTGDKVITTAGIHGIVHNVREHTVVVKVAEGTMIEFDKAAIGSVTKKDSAA